jgi:hypothetical protein
MAGRTGQDYTRNTPFWRMTTAPSVATVGTTRWGRPAPKMSTEWFAVERPDPDDPPT